MVDGADDRVHDALVAQRQRRVGRDAVLGVDDVVAPVAQRLAQALGVGVDQRADALVERGVGRDVGHDVRRDGGRAEEAGARRADREQLDLVPAVGQRAGHRERVHDAAARSHGVREHRDPHAIALAARRAAAALDGATTAPASPQRGGLARRVLRVGVGPADAHHHRGTPRSARNRARQLGGGIGVRAVAADDVEQDARRAAVVGRCLEHLQPDAQVDHRVRAPLRVALGPEVDDHVAVPLDGLGLGCDGAQQRIEHDARLVGERAAGEEAEDAPRARLHGAVVVGRARRAGRGERGGLERGVHLPAVEVALPAHERRDGPPPVGDRAGESVERLGLLGHEQQRLGVVVARQHREALAHHRAAHRGRQVAPADADDVRHAAAGGVDQAGDLLCARARGGDHAHGARAHHVGEAEADAGQHRGAALGPHHQEPVLGAAALERDLVLERDVV